MINWHICYLHCRSWRILSHRHADTQGGHEEWVHSTDWLPVTPLEVLASSPRSPLLVDFPQSLCDEGKGCVHELFNQNLVSLRLSNLLIDLFIDLSQSFLGLPFGKVRQVVHLSTSGSLNVGMGMIILRVVYAPLCWRPQHNQLWLALSNNSPSCTSNWPSSHTIQYHFHALWGTDELQSGQFFWRCVKGTCGSMSVSELPVKASSHSDLMTFKVSFSGNSAMSTRTLSWPSESGSSYWRVKSQSSLGLNLSCIIFFSSSTDFGCSVRVSFIAKSVATYTRSTNFWGSAILIWSWCFRFCYKKSYCLIMLTNHFLSRHVPLSLSISVTDSPSVSARLFLPFCLPLSILAFWSFCVSLFLHSSCFLCLCHILVISLFLPISFNPSAFFFFLPVFHLSAPSPQFLLLSVRVSKVFHISATLFLAPFLLFCLSVLHFVSLSMYVSSLSF